MHYLDRIRRRPLLRRATRQLAPYILTGIAAGLAAAITLALAAPGG